MDKILSMKVGLCDDRKLQNKTRKIEIKKSTRHSTNLAAKNRKLNLANGILADGRPTLMFSGAGD